MAAKVFLVKGDERQKQLAADGREVQAVIRYITDNESADEAKD